jgi:ATP-binding cassette, subfamily C, bacterial LapB
MFGCEKLFYWNLLMDSKKQKPFRDHWFFGPVLRQSSVYMRVIIASICVNLFALVSAFFVMTVYDKVIPNESMDTLWFLTFGVCIVIVFDFLMKMVRGVLTDKAGLEIDTEVSQTLFNHLCRNEKLIGTRSAGSVASVIREFDTIKDVLASATLVAFADLPFIFVFLFVLYSLGGFVAAVPAIVVLLVVMLGLIIQPIIKGKTMNAQLDGQNKHSVLVELLTGLETLKTLRGLSSFSERWRDSVTQQGKMLGQSRFWSQISANFAQVGQQISQVGIVVYGVILITNADMTMGALIACVILSGRVLAPLGQITNLIGRINQASVAYKNLKDLLNLESEENSRANNLEYLDVEGSLSLVNLSLKFNDAKQHSLSSVNLEMKPGEKIGVIGKIGSGKTSLLKVLSGVISPSEGLVQLDNISISQFRPDDLRRHISFMMQSSTLFSGTLKENLLLGNPNASDEDIIKASKITGVEAIATSLPNGYLTMLNEGGQKLSGGQKQAICIARTILNNSQIIFMDEPTSSMDNQTEASFIKNFQEWIGGRTLVVATHKGQLLQLVDRIVVLENGRVIADGKKEEILRPLNSKLKAIN